MTRTVLFLHSSSERYGADRQLALLMTGLDRGAWTPLAVLPHSGPLVEDLQDAGIEVIVSELAVLRRQHLTARGILSLGAGTAYDAAFLRGLIRRRNVALVHSNTSAVLAGGLGARLGGVPHVQHVREIYTGFGRPGRAFTRVLASGADVLACVSDSTAAQFGRGPGKAPPGKVTVIHDGLPRTVERAPRAPSRATLGLAQEAPVIGLLGRISEWKGQDVLIRALASAPLRERGAVALLAGSVWPGAEARRQRLLALADSLGVSERVLWAGFREDAETVYGACDVIVVPSTQPDPLPNAALEAAAAGCPVVAADHGGLPEIIAAERTGLLVAPGDPLALAGAVARLLDEPALAASLGEAAAADVRLRFAPGRMIDAVQALYARLLRS